MLSSKIFLTTLLLMLSLFQAHSSKIKFGANVIPTNCKKRSCEDRYIIPEKNEVNDFLIKKGIYLSAVCDGHGGLDVSQYIKENLAKKLLEKLSESDCVKTALRESIQEIEEEVLENIPRGGSTLVVVIYDAIKNRWITANIGDSRALLVNRETGEIRFKTIDHKPFNRNTEKEWEEYNRFFNAGGRLGYYVRRKSELTFIHDHYSEHNYYSAYLYLPECTQGVAMSRFIGGMVLKKHPENTEYGSEIFIATPDIEEIPAKNGDCFILGSDGLWEDISNENAAKLLLMNKKTKAKEVARGFCKSVKKKKIKRNSVGYHDDITTVFIKLQATEKKAIPKKKGYPQPLFPLAMSRSIGDGNLKSANLKKVDTCMDLSNYEDDDITTIVTTKKKLQKKEPKETQPLINKPNSPVNLNTVHREPVYLTEALQWPLPEYQFQNPITPHERIGSYIDNQMDGYDMPAYPSYLQKYNDADSQYYYKEDDTLIDTIADMLSNCCFF